MTTRCSSCHVAAPRASSRWQSEAGEAFSSLVLTLGIVIAVALAGGMVGPVLGGLVDDVESAATTGEVSGSDSTTTDGHDHDHDHDHDHNTGPAGDEAPSTLRDGSVIPPLVREIRGDIVEILEAGDDDTLWEQEVQDIQDLLDGLSPEEVAWVWETLSEDQRERLIEEFLSHDPTDAEIAEFLALFDDATDYPLDVIGRDDPVASGFNAALAEAFALSENDPWLRTALTTLVTQDAFGDLDYNQQTAILAQFNNYAADADPTVVTNLISLAETESFQDMSPFDAQRAAKTVAFLSTYEPEGGDTTVMDNTLDLILGEDAQIPFDFGTTGTSYGQATTDGAIHLNPKFIPSGNDPIADSDAGALRVLTHTIEHEVNHSLNGDRRAATFNYFMGEYRAFYVGQTAKYGRPPTRAEVEQRVLGLLNEPWIDEEDLGEDEKRKGYSYLDKALSDGEHGPLIAGFVSEVLGREVTPENAVTELEARSDDPDELAPLPVSVGDGPNNLTNEPDS